MTDLSRPLASDARREPSPIATPSLDARQTSTDGTTKFLLRLADGRQIESVFIPDTPAQTFCVSTQVGCAMGCAFCLTGKMGLVRNLTAGEIAGQVRVLAHDTGLAGTAFNIVLMGMGEPLHNYDATMKALRMLADEHGSGRARRSGSRCRRSACCRPSNAWPPKPLMPNLAISLHATTDEQRERLVPLNRKLRPRGR